MMSPPALFARMLPNVLKSRERRGLRDVRTMSIGRQKASVFPEPVKAADTKR